MAALCKIRFLPTSILGILFMMLPALKLASKVAFHITGTRAIFPTSCVLVTAMLWVTWVKQALTLTPPSPNNSKPFFQTENISFKWGWSPGTHLSCGFLVQQNTYKLKVVLFLFGGCGWRHCVQGQHPSWTPVWIPAALFRASPQLICQRGLQKMV